MISRLRFPEHDNFVRSMLHHAIAVLRLLNHGGYSVFQFLYFSAGFCRAPSMTNIFCIFFKNSLAKINFCAILKNMIKHGAVAQLARASHWQCEGREFESLLLHHVNSAAQSSGFFVAFFRGDFQVKTHFLSSIRPA